MTTTVGSDRSAWESAAWGACLREQGERLAEEVVLLLDQTAETEERVANAFARRAMVAHERADELWRYACRAQAVANRLRARQKYDGK
jgi:hypothetical protein